ncbi:MAG: zf-TFIIB domain-containing protein [Planctomycetota bacterium]
MHCPICEAAMTPVQYEGITIDVCDLCGGEFLDQAELGHVVRVREQKFSPQMQKYILSRPPRFGLPEEQRERQISCPKCDGEMVVLNYGGDSGIYIDRCRQCGGFWLDADELELIQVFQEEWEAQAPAMIQAVAADLEAARRTCASSTNNTFAGSRFAFVNALVNRLLDAA